MITKEQALTANEFHFENGAHKCRRVIGKRGGITDTIVRVRRNGKTQTWKRDTTRFRVPIKHGMYDYGEITLDNAMNFHTPQDCPLLKEEQDAKVQPSDNG